MKPLRVNTPEETAEALIKENYSLEKYLEIQEYRKTRLKKFEGTGIIALVKAEQNLITHGEKVIQLMQEAYAKK